MATVAQVEANRLNAQKSTGPQTPEGKARSAQNALRHGLTSTSTVVLGEDQNQWEELRQSFFDQYQPVDPTEETLVDMVADFVWRLARARRVESEVLNTGIVAIGLVDNPVAVEDDCPSSETGSALPKAPCARIGEFRLGSAFIVRQGSLERMSRYEASLRRGFYRALQELERRQNQRLASGAGAKPVQHPEQLRPAAANSGEYEL